MLAVDTSKLFPEQRGETGDFAGVCVFLWVLLHLAKRKWCDLALNKELKVQNTPLRSHLFAIQKLLF